MPERMDPALSQRGFTLLEVLLAVTLVGILAAITVGMLHAGMNTREIVNSRGGESRTLRLALDIMARPLCSALPPRGILAGEFNGTNDGDLDELTFHAALDPGDDFGGDAVKITYRVDETSYDLPALVRETTRNLLAGTVQDPDIDILCRNVGSLNFSYYDGSQWLDEWHSAENNNILPKAVMITLSLPANDTSEDHNAETDVPTLWRIVPLPCTVEDKNEEAAK